MANNEDNTRQLNQGNSEVLSAIQDLSGRLTTVEEIILARLNDTRPFEHQMMASINELAANIIGLTGKVEALGTVLNEFRQETNQNFRIVSKKMALLNEDFLSYRTDQALLEKRVETLEERAAA